MATMTPATAVPRARGRRMLLVIAALFLVPVATAFALYYAGSWRPAGATNHGELIVPARPLPAVSLAPAEGAAVDGAVLRGKWTLVYVGDGSCASDCATALHAMRQTRLALGDKMTRVQRVFLATQDCCNREFLEREHRGLLVFDASGAPAADLVQRFPLDERAHSLFVVDPLGNLMMRFDTRANPKGLLEDLKKLLLLSHIG
jgi:hypothetical protein